MHILGINTGFNASAVLLKNNEVIFGIQEERLSRIKNQPGFPTLAVKACLEAEKLSADDLSMVAVASTSGKIPKDRESELHKFQHRYDLIKQKWFNGRKNPLTALVRRYVNKIDCLTKSTGNGLGLQDHLKANDLLEKVHCFDHHTCHAAAAYYGLARNKGEKHLIFTLDGGGDGRTSAVFIGHNNQLQLIAESNSFSPACLYAHLTYISGFLPHEHEYKLMGLAPYAQRKYAEKVRDSLYRFIGLDEKNPLVFTNTSKYPSVDNSGGPQKHQLIEEIFRSVLNVRFDTLAAGLQMLAEEVVVRWIREGIQQTGIQRVLLSGGFFMNVKANQLISELPEVKSVNCFPSCGDETNAFGAAYLGYEKLRQKANPDVKFLNFCVGPQPNCDDMIQRKYQDKICVEKMSQINAKIVDLLVAGKIVARCSGPMEFGVRALGNRSILAAPDDVRVINKINAAIKKRDFWMPFAPAVLQDKAELVIDIPLSVREAYSPYMMFTFQTKPEKFDQMIAGTQQMDKSARAQLVSRETYPDFYDIIEGFFQKTGIPAVLNTSFNLHGFPIVCTAEEAIEVYLNSALDVLVVDDYMITRRQ